jgi:hypothetical protein
MKGYIQETPSEGPGIDYPMAYTNNVAFVAPPVPHQAELYPLPPVIPGPSPYVNNGFNIARKET